MPNMRAGPGGNVFELLDRAQYVGYVPKAAFVGHRRGRGPRDILTPAHAAGPPFLAPGA